MKRIELFFLGVLVPVDYAALMLAALAAFALRFGALARLLPTTVTIPFPEFMGSAAIFSLFFLLIFAASGLYNPTVRRRMAGEFPRIILATSTGIAVVIVSIFFQREFFASRFIVLAAWAFAILFVFGGRLFMRAVQYALLRAGIGIHRLVMVGNTASALAIGNVFSRQFRWASTVVGRFPRWDDATRAALLVMRERNEIDDVLLTDATTPREDIVAMQTFCDDHHLGFRYTADLLQTEHASIEIVTIAGVPVVVVKRTSLEGWGAIAKRFFDLIGSVVLIIILSPLMLIVALAVKFGSRGPIIFRNVRVGMHGDEFQLFKFRSMFAELSTGEGFGGKRAEELEEKLIREQGAGHAPVYKMPESDPRITPVGRFIRRYSLDELPQLFNVFMGAMSLVGPRPHQPREVAKYASHHRRVLAIKPGITGLAQISGRRELPFEDEVRLDNYYIEHWSPWLDFIILMKTPFVVLSRKGAS